MPNERDNSAVETRPKLGLSLCSRGLAAVVSVGAHLAILACLFAFRPTPLAPPTPPVPPEAIFVTVAPRIPPAPAEESAEEAGEPPPTPPKPPSPPPRQAVRPPPIPPPPDIPPVPAPAAPTPQPMPGLSDAQLAGAITVGNGMGVAAGPGAGGGGEGNGAAPCDMVRRLQDALGRDPDIRAAVIRETALAGPGARGVHVWNGDWVQSPSQEGKGLAGVRQAIALEIAFAPAACRAQSMRGLVVLSIGDGPRPARLALGGGAWRWTDLLARGIRRG